MLTVSSTYKSIIAGAHNTEFKVQIGDFVYGSESVISMEVNRSLFGSGGAPSVGGFPSAEVDIVMLRTGDAWPRMAPIFVSYRISNATKTSEWVPVGHFFIDTRKPDLLRGTITIHGYDAALKAEQDYLQTGDKDTFPKMDYNCYSEICSKLGVLEDTETRSLLRGYWVSSPSMGDGCLSVREVAQYIASANCGNFCITSDNRLRLVQLNSLPDSDGLLIHENGGKILVGGVAIRVS